ncbi:unnamed protein product [Oppiella nova]|uniref:Uncharacterized protein n=1 Tax=Oppiella nova TaxID=334625 RepID=A0A7R9M8U4_9ACAR|nr:unnamed protein product [Oppiella nova]CAG2172372.1 unnamed protein product [Oppiella nova]
MSDNIFDNLSGKILIATPYMLSEVSDKVDDNLIIPIYLGGPVEHERGFFLHSDDYNKNLLLHSQNDIAVSSNPEIPQDIISGNGPKNTWKGGQLENELKNNLWIVADCDKELIFSDNPEKKWYAALKYLGIDMSCFASQMVIYQHKILFLGIGVLTIKNEYQYIINSKMTNMKLALFY